MPEQTLTLRVRRTIRATPERLFAAWTDPAQLRQWWGPANVTCPEAEVDLRVGGRYRLANRLPDGQTVWIGGTFERVEPPHELVYTWQVEGGPPSVERVTVRFESRDGATDVSIVHERLADQATYEDHEGGWDGCLDGLRDYLAGD